jgi:plastocyanin
VRLRALIGVAALAVTVLFAAIATAAGGTKEVFVGDNFFEPAKTKVKKGDRVSFEWIGSEEHEIAKSKGPGKFFHSGPKTDGDEFRHRFTERGTYKVICTLHEDMRMKLEVN